MRRHGMKRHSRALAVLAALALPMTACGSQAPTSASTSTNRLEVVSWWTSGSEAPALDALLAAYRQANPGVTTVNAAVKGGAGSQAIVALAKRLQRGDPPDVWQTFAGASVQGYARRGVIRDVASVFSSGGLTATTMQPTIYRSLFRDGKPYGVPTGAHRSNMLWFNTGVLAKAGVTPPVGGYTLSRFVDDLQRLQASGVAPM